MSPIALLHTALGVTALATGAAVLARRKGDRLHRRLGWVYAGSLLSLCALSFGLRASTPFFQGLGPFHAAAVVSFVTTALGVWAVRARPAAWLQHHYMWMGWSYIGLVMATGGHLQAPLGRALAAVGVEGAAAVAVSLGVLWGLPPLVGGRWLKARAARFDRLGAAPAV